LNKSKPRFHRAQTPQTKDLGSSPYERYTRKIHTADNEKRHKRKNYPNKSFQDIYEDFKNAKPQAIALTDIFIARSNSEDTSSETEWVPVVAEVPFSSRRPRTASGLMLAEYEFGHSFKEEKARASSAPLSRVCRYHGYASSRTEEDNRPPTRQRPPPEALHLM